jgi:hypothetical protein
LYFILAMTLAFLLVSISLPARPAGIPALGVVTQASAAHFNAARVSAGATVYDGDRLSTESEGLPQFCGAGSLLYYPAEAVSLCTAFRMAHRRTFHARD